MIIYMGIIIWIVLFTFVLLFMSIIFVITGNRVLDVLVLICWPLFKLKYLYYFILSRYSLIQCSFPLGIILLICNSWHWYVLRRITGRRYPHRGALPVYDMPYEFVQLPCFMFWRALEWEGSDFNLNKPWHE